jgi:hypothetical protein
MVNRVLSVTSDLVPLWKTLCSTLGNYPERLMSSLARPKQFVLHFAGLISYSVLRVDFGSAHP